VAACDDIALAPYRHGGRALVEARLAAVRVVGEIAHREDSRGQVALGREVANRLNRNRIAEGDDRRRPIVSGRDVTLGGDVTALGEGKRSEEHTSELQSRENLVCRLLLEKKN